MRFLRIRAVQVVVIVTYFVLLVVSCYGATLVEDGLEAREIARAGGALDRFLELEERCGKV